MKRKTVTPNLPVLLPMVKEKCRSYVAFTKAIRGKDNSGWVTEWSRGSNYPSPEEAAKMCLLLQTTPEEILLHSDETEEKTQKCLEDIEEVKRLIEEERGRNVEKAPADKSGSQSEEEFTRLFQQLSPEEQANEIAYLRERIAREAAKDK